MLGMAYVGEIAALVTALMWVLCSLAFTAAGRHIGSISVNLLRLLVAFVFFTLTGLIFRGHPLPADATGHAWFWLSLSGVVGFFLGDLCLFRSFLLIGPRLSLLICSLVPPITAVLAYVWLGEELRRWDWIGMAVTLAGVVWVVLERREAAPEPAAPAGDGTIPDETDPPGRQGVESRRLLTGSLLALGGAVGQAGGVVLSKIGMKGYNPFASAHIRLIAAVACFAILITLLRRWGNIVAAVRHARAMTLLTFGAFTGPFLGVGLQLLAVENTKAGVATTLMAVAPVLILPFVIVLHREKISARAWAGALVAVAGVAILMLGR
ncbi:MAG: DMT family transporter [Planctomycetaceae bacterium]|nr:DMT family transporter [Planctomycetaceae bacterium]